MTQQTDGCADSSVKRSSDCKRGQTRLFKRFISSPRKSVSIPYFVLCSTSFPPREENLTAPEIFLLSPHRRRHFIISYSAAEMSLYYHFKWIQMRPHFGMKKIIKSCHLDRECFIWRHSAVFVQTEVSVHLCRIDFPLCLALLIRFSCLCASYGGGKKKERRRCSWISAHIYICINHKINI